MKKLKQIKWLPFIFLMFVLSCSQDDGVEKLDEVAQENFVELSKIKEVASDIFFTSTIKSSNEDSSGATKNIEEIHEILNGKGKTVLYVVNYDEGGFILLSADKRTQPILGFSEDNNFDVNEDSFSIGLQYWMQDAKKQLTDIQNSKIEQSEKEAIAWRQIKHAIASYKRTTKKEPIEDCYDHSVTHTKGPLLNSTWYQIGGFNDAMPNITCNGYVINAYAGCVPIAMGQIMKYHQYPTSYNWSSIPLAGATTTTADFIADIHDAIRSIYVFEPSYGCDGTGVSSSANMGSVLKTKFGYSSASKSSFNSNTIENNIYYNRPVLLSGRNSSTGHMWVCDGYKSTTIYNADCSATGYLKLHMNWGWGGSHDGWYSFDNFNPSNTHYNNRKAMIYNIIP